VWEAHLDGIPSGETVQGGTLFVSANDGALYALAGDCGTGGTTCQPTWAWHVPGDSALTNPVVAEGIVFVGSGDGHLYALSASGAAAP